MMRSQSKALKSALVAAAGVAVLVGGVVGASTASAVAAAPAYTCDATQNLVGGTGQEYLSGQWGGIQ
jgi:hypothetical protein